MISKLAAITLDKTNSEVKACFLYLWINTYMYINYLHGLANIYINYETFQDKETGEVNDGKDGKEMISNLGKNFHLA